MTASLTPEREQQLRQQIAEGLMHWAERGNSPAYAAVRRQETVVKNADARADAVLPIVRAAVADAVRRAFTEAADRLAELRASEREWLPATGLHTGEQELRRMADAGASGREQGEAAAETDEQRADRLETERAHAEGEHAFCGVDCEVEMPSDALRNFIIAKGYPGTAGALDELLRRAREQGGAE